MTETIARRITATRSIRRGAHTRLWLTARSAGLTGCVKLGRVGSGVGGRPSSSRQTTLVMLRAPQVAMDAQGDAVAVWMQRFPWTSIVADIRSNRFWSGAWGVAENDGMGLVVTSAGHESKWRCGGDLEHTWGPDSKEPSGPIA